MEITGLKYIDGNGIRFGSTDSNIMVGNGIIADGKATITAIGFISKNKRYNRFSAYDNFTDDLLNRSSDVYKVTLSDEKVVVLPADKYMALYE